jgi:protein phosphatase
MKQTTDSNFNFLWCGEQTDTGQVRKANEDSKRIFEVANMKVFVVCDGMGGHVGGKMASETAINAIHDFFLNNITLDPREAIYHSIIAANEAILNKARQQPELTGMGSTCVMLVVTSDGKAYYGHVGDSRIYIFQGRDERNRKQLTKDHSFVQLLVDAGQITKEQAEHHSRKNEITNALGLPNMQPPTVCREPIEPEAGNCFLLCSDGLTGMVSDDRIQRIICKHEINIQVRADELVKTANNNGGVDNITVELVEFTVGTQQIGGGGKKPIIRKKLLPYLLPALVILGGLAWFLSTKFFPKPDESVGSEYDSVTTETSELVLEIVPEPYFAKPVVFTKKGEIFKTEITGIFFNDAIIDKNTVEVVNNTVSSVAIKGKKIHAEWNTKCDTVTILCKTKDGNDCTIKIPVEKEKMQSNNSAKQTIKVTLGDIDYGDIDYKNPVIVEVDSVLYPLTDGKTTEPPAKTNQETVRCSVNKENNLVVHFQTQDFESPIVVTVETVNATYEFSIPVKMPEKEEITGTTHSEII